MRTDCTPHAPGRMCSCIMTMRMRPTPYIDDDLIGRTREVTGIREKTALVKAGLEAQVAREAGRRLASLGGTQPKLREIPRRRFRAARRSVTPETARIQA